MLVEKKGTRSIKKASNNTTTELSKFDDLMTNDQIKTEIITNKDIKNTTTE